MKVFLSADIEGTAFTTLWSETETDSSLYPAAARQMTAEVRAACEGAIAAGADFILVKDAHGKGINIDPNGLPREAVLERGWSGSPMAMVDGVDESFDAAMFVGYHSPAGERGNPLSHTYSKKTTRVLLNGVPCSEFMLYSFACVTCGVPCVLLTGDRALTDASSALHPKLVTVAVKEGFGGLTR
ncbi:MAG: M55 family metallopeptidase, partial [Clostridia bacterium]|nr:M55 family metallopeptidase [Clostridia bacterium]